MKKQALALVFCMALTAALAFTGCATTPIPVPPDEGGEKPPVITTPELPVKVTVTEGEETDSRSYETIGKALPKVKKKIADAKGHVSVKISLAEGTFPLTETAALSYGDLAGKDYELTIAGAGADKTVVTSEYEIDGSDFEDMGDDIYAYSLPDECMTDGVFPALHDLALDGKLLPMARTEIRTIADSINRNDAKQVLLVDAGLLSGVPASEIAGTEIWIKNIWCYIGARIVGYDPLNAVYVDGNALYPVEVEAEDFAYLSMNGGCSYNTELTGDPYWLANKLAFLTEPNTFVYDREDGIFYVKTDGTDPSELHYTIPMLSQLMTLEDVKNVTIEGIAFRGTTSGWMTEHGYVRYQAGAQRGRSSTVWTPDLVTDAAIYVRDAQNLTVKNCSFADLGYDGVSLSGKVKDAAVTGNGFDRIDACALRIGTPEAYSPLAYNYGVTIENNRIENIAEEYLSSPALQVFFAQDLSIKYNTIRHTSYSAISLGWSWRLLGDGSLNLRNVEVAYNYIEDYITKMMDGGAIYCLGGNAAEANRDFFNTMHDNFVVITDQAAALPERNFTPQGYYMCLYLDGASSNWKVFNNVICSVDETNPSRHSYIYYQYVKNQQTHNLHSEHNYVVNILDEYRLFGPCLTNGELYNLTETDNYAVPDYASLKENYPAALEIVAAAGADGCKGVWPQE